MAGCFCCNRVCIGDLVCISCVGHFLDIGLLFGAFGAVGEVGYLLIERTWGRPRLPRWLLVGVWTLIAPTIAYTAMEIAKQHIGIIEGVILVMIGCTLPVVASWPFRSQPTISPMLHSSSFSRYGTRRPYALEALSRREPSFLDDRCCAGFRTPG